MVPSMVLLFGPMVAFVFLSKFEIIPSQGWDGFKWFSLSFLTGFFGAWLIWSIQIPRWRLWAYQSVNDIQALKKMAVNAGLIWPDGHSFEIASREVRERIRRLEHPE